MSRYQRRNSTGLSGLRGLGEISPEARTYWKRFIAVAWGWPTDRINGTDGAYIRPQIEETLRNDANLYLTSKGTIGWFAGRPEEYALFISEYGGTPANFTPAVGTPVYQPSDAAAVVNQLHAAEQGMQTLFNQGPLSVLPNPATVSAPSQFSVGPSRPVTPSQAAQQTPVAVPGAGSGYSPYYPVTAGFPDVGVGPISSWEPQPQTGPTPGGSGDISKIVLAALGALAFFNT